MFPDTYALASGNKTQIFLVILPDKPDILFAIPRERIILDHSLESAEEGMYLPYAWHKKDLKDLVQQIVADTGPPQNPRSKVSFTWQMEWLKLSDIHSFHSNAEEKKQAANSVLLLHKITKNARKQFRVYGET